MPEEPQNNYENLEANPSLKKCYTLKKPENGLDKPDHPISRPLLFHFLAAVITLLSFFVRANDLETNPNGFFCDEASIAYNAKSILETGADEHGRSLPVYFKCFGDYKSGFYIYSVVVSTAIFGESHFATRLPAAFYLTLAMVIAYLFLACFIHPFCGLLAVALMAYDPWLNHFSHIAFELSTVPLFISASTFFWFKAINGKPKYFILSSLFFALTFYAYPPARLFVPLFTIGLVIIFRKAILELGCNLKYFCSFIGLSLLLAIPFINYIFYEPEFLERVNYLNLFSTPYIKHSAGYKWLLEHFQFFKDSADTNPDFFKRSLIYCWNYLAYLSPEYLFFSGDSNPRFGTTCYGIFGLASLPGFITGLFFLFKRREMIDKLLLLWLFLYPLPGALTWEDIPHSGRGIVMHPAFSMIAAIGYWQILRLLKHFKTHKILITALTISLICCVGLWVRHIYNYSVFYHNRYSGISSGWMQYGYKNAINYIEENHHKYKKVVIVSTYLHYQSYIFVLYYGRVSPADWQLTKKLPWDVEIYTHDLPESSFEKDVLYVFATADNQRNNKFIKVYSVKYENRDSDAFTFYEYAQNNRNPDG